MAAFEARRIIKSQNFQKPDFSCVANGSNNPDLAWIWKSRSELGERVILLRDTLRPEFGGFCAKAARQIWANIGDRGTPYRHQDQRKNRLAIMVDLKL